MKIINIFLLFLLLVVLVLISLFVGKFSLSWSDYLNVFNSKDIASVIIFDIRMPRILAAVLVGGALSVSGAVYQAMFANPLVSPSVLGVLSGASFGAALGMMLNLHMFAVQSLTFIFGFAAVAIALIISLMADFGRVLMLILGGVVSSAIFSSFLSIVKYFSDTQYTLPNIIYFLMGSLTFATKGTIIAIGWVIALCIVLMIMLSSRINALSLGDDEAKSLGIDTKKLKIALIFLATLSSSLSVILGGIIGWIGLIVPHICRFIFGADNRYVLISSAISGAIFLLICDNIARQIYTYEMPIGIITSLFGIPIFLLVLFRIRNQ